MDTIKKTLVMKFGGSVLTKPADFLRVAKIVAAKKETFSRIVVVVSAMRDMTDQLFSMAHDVHPSPPEREVDMLVSVGERMSISLLAMALNRLGEKAVSFTGSQSGVITCDQHSDARIIDVRPDRLLPHLEQGEIVIVAGFQGVSQKRDITTLGRGGSDTTAVALGVCLEAECVEFYKDVAGIYPQDPKKAKGDLIKQLSFADAKNIAEDGGVLSMRSLLLAEENHMLLHLLSMEKGASGSYICPDANCAKKYKSYELGPAYAN